VTVAARSSWKGYLRFSLVSMPVKAYPATISDGGGVKLNHLHFDLRITR
jgi:non-homologous end joining protein Ku